MPKTSSHKIPILLAVALVAVTGCSDGERVAKVATEAADRQAEQNVEMAQLNREVAAGTKSLVSADAEARKELTKMQHDLQAEQAKVSTQRDQLETERQEIASQRRAESMWGSVLKGCSVVALCAVTIGFCWYLLFGLRHLDATDRMLNELLIEELVSESSTILPMASPASERAALPADERDPQRLPKPD
jgi:hypothetical protein